MAPAVDVAAHEIVICCALNGSFSHGVCRDVSADAPSLQGGSSIVKLRVVVELADDMWAVASVKRLAQQPAVQVGAQTQQLGMPHDWFGG